MSQSSAVDRDIEITRLSNGIDVITESMSGVRSVAVGLWIGTGSRSERPADNGISHFIEHMLFKGTPTRSAEDIARQVDSLGGNLDAFTGKELVGFNTKVLDEHLPQAFDILSDLVLHPCFRDDDLEKEKGVVLEELKMENDSAESLVHELFVSNFWKRHALGRPILGTRKTIRSFDSARLRDYHSKYYTASNLTITAAGHLNHAALLEVAQRQFGALGRGEPARTGAEPQTHAAVQLKNKRSLHQVHLCLGVPSYPASHQMRFACYVLNVILGAGMSSRLFQNIRERQGLAYSIGSELHLYTDTGCMGIYAGTSLENVRRVVDSVLAEFRQLKNNALPEEELRRAKDHMKGSLMLGLESTTSRMGNLARQWLYFHRFFTLDELLDSIEAVTADQVVCVAREFFQPEKIGLTLLGKLDGLTLDRDALSC